MRLLKLRAEDAQDLAVMAAILQDARIPLREMVFEQEHRRFLAAFRRYRRELLPDPCAVSEELTEISSVLGFLEVAGVRYRRLDPSKPEEELALLTIATEPGRAHPFHIRLLFDGGKEILLLADGLRAWLEDFGEPAPAQRLPPDHMGDEPTGA